MVPVDGSSFICTASNSRIPIVGYTTTRGAGLYRLSYSATTHKRSYTYQVTRYVNECTCGISISSGAKIAITQYPMYQKQGSGRSYWYPLSQGTRYAGAIGTKKRKFMSPTQAMRQPIAVPCASDQSRRLTSVWTVEFYCLCHDRVCFTRALTVDIVFCVDFRR